MYPSQKLEPYYLNQFEMNFCDGGITYIGLTEYVISYKIEDRILWVDMEVSQGKFIENFECLKASKEIRIRHFDKSGNVYFQLEGETEFISTTGFAGDYEGEGCMRIKVSYVFKNLDITEDGRYGSIGHPETIKLF